MKDQSKERVKGRRGEGMMSLFALLRPFTLSPFHPFTLSLLVLLSLCLSVSGQSGRKPQPNPNAPQQPGEKPVFRLETKEVVVPLSAYDAEGRLVHDLTAKDVIVLEDGEARPVSFIRHEPANIVLILDLNNEYGTFKNASHMGWLTKQEENKPSDGSKPIWQKQHDYQIVARPTTREFADNLISKLSPADSLAIIQYADKVQLMQDWTSDRKEALHALQSKYRIGLKGRFYDALKLAADKLEERKTGRRVVILISDGLDSASKTNRKQAFNALTRAQATTFVVGWSEALKDEITVAINRAKAGQPAGIDLLGNARKRIAELQRYVGMLEGTSIILRDLAESSGGEFLLPPSYEAILTSPRRLTEEIGAQYSLAFVTETKPSLENTRDIQVMAARPGLTVRSRRSYWIDDEPRWQLAAPLGKQ
jgi:VWFA-related protein